MKRFYKQATVAPAEGGYAVLLDGKLIRTPAKAGLVVKSRKLAEAMAEEWQTQGEEIDPVDLPLTRLAGTVIDLIEPRRAQIIAEIAKYATTDLLCYRAEGPHELASRQHAAWQGHLDWAGSRYAPLAVTRGIAPLEQAPEALEVYAAAVAAHDSMILAALYIATSVLGSLVLALALIEGRIDAEQAFAASQIDESFQIERWGEDAEAARRRAGIKDDIDLASRFVYLHRAG